MEAFTINTDTQEIELTKADNGLEALSETENFEQSTLHEKDIEAAAMLDKFGLKFTDVSDKHRHLKVYNTQLTNNGMNYIGGKYELLPIIKQLTPSEINHHYDFFGGAGTMGINITANYLINNEYDKNLSNVVRGLSENTAEFNYQKLLDTMEKYNLTSIETIKSVMLGKVKSLKWSTESRAITLTDFQFQSELFCWEHIFRFKNNFETLKSDFNNSKDKPWEMFLTIILFSYDFAIRYNKNNMINTSFNDKNFSKSLKAKLLLFSKKITKNKDKYSFYAEDYVNLLKKIVFKKNDFLYFDPPYFLTTNEYTKKYWSREAEIKFLGKLKDLNDRDEFKKNGVFGKNYVKFGLSNVIHHEGKTNDLLINFINDNNLYVHYLPKSYDGASKAAKTKKYPTVEVYVTNYPTLVCPEPIKVPMEYDKSKISTHLIQMLRQDSQIIQGRLVDYGNEVENIIKYQKLAEEAWQSADGYKRKSIEQRVIEINHRKQVGINCLVLKEKNKGNKGAYGLALEKTGVSKSKAEHYMKFVKNKRIMTLKDEELLEIPMLTYTKLVKMMELDDDDFYKVVKGELSILSKIVKEKASQTKADKPTEAEEAVSENVEVENEFINPISSSDKRRQVLKSYDNDKLIDIIEKQSATIEEYEKLLMGGSSMPKYPALNNTFPKVKAS